MNQIIYFDNSATTKLNDEVFKSMKEFLIENFSNPSSIYELSQKSRVAIEKSRENLAKYINANKNEIFFTSSGTESDNWALIGSTIRRGYKSGHIITTAFEHSAVLETCKFLEKMGFDVTYINPDKNGFISYKDIVDKITDDTIIVSVMLINNEVGTIQDIKTICSKVKEKNKNIIFHTDAVQALSEISIDVEELGIDLMTFSAHKIHGPKGVGALYIRQGTNIENLILGGSQERQRRAGTENVAGIVGFSKAIDVLNLDLLKNVEKRKNLKEYLLIKLKENFNNFKINGSLEHRHSGNLNISFLDIDKEMLIMNMDFNGICISSGSACSSGSLENSHVLSSMKIDSDLQNSAIRVSLGEENTKDEIDKFIEVLKSIFN